MSIRLLEEHKPKTPNEIVASSGWYANRMGGGAKACYEQALKYLNNGDQVLLCGPPGVGKTLITEILASENNWRRREFNMSNYRTTDAVKVMTIELRSPVFHDILYVMEEVDGFNNAEGLVKIVEASEEKKMVYTANETYYLPKEFLKKVRMVKVYRPNQKAVLNFVKKIAAKEGILNADYTKVTSDIRSSIQVLLGSVNYTEKDNFTFIRDILSGKKVTKSDIKRQKSRQKMYHRTMVMWLLEEGTKVFGVGGDYIRFVKWLSEYDIYKEPAMLRVVMSRGFYGRVEYPKYPGMKKKRIINGGNKK